MEVRHALRLVVRDVLGEFAEGVEGEDLVDEFGVSGRILEKIVEEGAKGNGGGIAASEATLWSMKRA